MRIAVLLATFLLVAGCSDASDGQARQGGSSLAVPSSSPTSPTRKAPPPPGPPTQETPVADVITWIGAGNDVDTAEFHSAIRDGETTQLGSDVAFTTPSGTTTCMTDSKYGDGALACLVQLTDPPPRPTMIDGEWIGGWVDFNGSTIAVGSIHGDPGRFVFGKGPQLKYGDALKFGDYQCRADETGLFCVDYAHRSAVGLRDTGIWAFGCVTDKTPPADIGVQFSC